MGRKSGFSLGSAYTSICPRIATGNLPREAFQRYIAQDAFFLDAFARSYALALAHSPDQQGIHDFFKLLAGVQEELRLHANCAEKWGISLANVTPGSATLDYTNFLLGTAFSAWYW